MSPIPWFVMVRIRDRVAALIEQGMAKEQVIAAKPPTGWDATWGTRFMKLEVFLRNVCESMKQP